MNEASPSGSAAPETPAPKPPSRKTLYIILGGVCVFLCACLCLAAAVAGVYGISRFANGAGFAGGLNSHRVSNASWQMEVTSIQSSATEIMDSSGGSASPKAGYIFIIVTAKIKNISGKTQSFYLSAGGSNAGLKEKDGTLLDLAAVKRGDSGMTINFANQMQILFIYSAQETYEFYFVALESDRGPFTFTYMDLPPVGPLSLR